MNLREPSATAGPWRVTASGACREWPSFSLAVVGATAYGVLTVLTARVLGHLVQDVVGPAARDHRLTGSMVGQVVWQLGGVVLLNVLAVILRRIAAGITYNNLIATSRLRLTRAYQRLPMAWHTTRPAGQLLSRANSDTEQIWSIFQPLPMALGVVIMVLFGFISIFLVDPFLGTVALVVFPTLIVMNYWFQKVTRARVETSQTARAQVSALADESFDGALIVKALGRRDREMARFVSGAEGLRDANIRLGRTQGLFDPMTNALPTLGTLLVVVVGAHRVASGDLRPGDVIEVAYLFNLMAWPVRAFGWILTSLPNVAIGWKRTKPIIDEADAVATPPASPTLADGPLSARLEHVSLTYGDGHEVLHDVTLDIAAGERVAIVGATGSGKSSLVNVLAGLIEPTNGLALVSGHPIAGAANRTDRVLLATQSAFVFNDSVRENVALGRENVTETDLQGALAASRADEFVSTLPAGVEENLGEGGNRLSGGQRQRIALARALAGQPGLVILDDATSAIDARIESQILDRLGPATDGSTSVIVAHRKSAITLADRVVFLSGGRIADVGTHEELMTQNPEYAALLTAYDSEPGESA